MSSMDPAQDEPKGIDDVSPDHQLIKPNVIAKPIRKPGPHIIAMPQVLSDIPFRTPSQIVGTPFTTSESSPYEYPFPDLSLSPSESHSPPVSASFTSSPGLKHFSSSSQILRPASPRGSFQLPPVVPKHTRAHPKMLPPVAPVPPPGLAKKLQRWSLGLLRRRNNSISQEKESGDALPDDSNSTPASSSPHPVIVDDQESLSLTLSIAGVADAQSGQDGGKPLLPSSPPPT